MNDVAKMHGPLAATGLGAGAARGLRVVHGRDRGDCARRRDQPVTLEDVDDAS